MKESKKEICTVQPCLINGYLVISLDSKWVDVFQKIPTFHVTIDKRKLLIMSEEIPNSDKNE